MKYLQALTLSSILLAAASPALAQQDHTHLPVRIQVAAQNTQTTLRVSATSEVKALTSLGWKSLGHLRPEVPLQVSSTGGGLRLSSLNNQEIYTGLRLETPNDSAMVQTHQAWYRGGVTIKPSGTGFSTINEVSLEQYLYSVVPSEMPASWPIEALKSQAVAARTYALSHLGQYRKQGFDLMATTASQVYQGVKAEHPNSIQAVEDTRGEIMTHNGKPIHAYFHSTSGGMTENGADLWAAMPYLKPVEDFDHASPKHTWHTQLSQAEVQQRLRNSDLRVQVGQVMFLSPLKYTQGGRIKTLRVHGSQGHKDVDGLKFRMALKLNSTFFNVGAINTQGELIKQPDGQAPQSFQFAGRGWGHGLGMSQWGARQLALDGKSYRDILSHYYRGVRIEPLNPRAYQVASAP